MNSLSRRAQAVFQAPMVFAAVLAVTFALPAKSTVPASTSVEPSLALCAKAGTVERWNAGGGFTFLPKSGNRLYAMRLLGEDFAAHREMSHPAMQIDGIFYQFLFVPISDFAPSERRPDADVLAQHAAWEFQAAQRASGKLDRFQDLGNKARPAGNGFEAATFKLWRMHNADDSAAQFFVTTVVGGEVVVMSAILRPVPGTPERFRTVFRHYAETLNWWSCPG
jgi:hypothetical protein